MREHKSPPKPRARQDDILVEKIDEEILLYDQTAHTAHCLSPVAAYVWRHCDGKHDLAELAELSGASKDLVAHALRELHEKDLLDADPTLTPTADPGVSRREAIGRFARVGAAAAVPLVVSATAATPAMAESGEKENCRTEPKCAVDATAICCCCGNGEGVTATRDVQTCAMACIGRGGAVSSLEGWKHV